MILEEPDIEIGAGVSSKGKHLSIATMTITHNLQPLVDVFHWTPLVVGVEVSAAVAVSTMDHPSPASKTDQSIILATFLRGLNKASRFRPLCQDLASSFLDSEIPIQYTAFHVSDSS